MEEAIVTINGVQLTVGQSMALRVAIGSFAESMLDKGLGDDTHGKAMAQAYIARASEIEQLMVHSPAECGNCRATSADSCNANGCFFLENGNGEPV